MPVRLYFKVQRGFVEDGPGDLGGAILQERVFEHKGGFILDENGKSRDLEPKPPGWYYRWEAYGNLHLSGPFETKEDAEFYC